jgi:Domain of unknown function (DUF4920)
MFARAALLVLVLAAGCDKGSKSEAAAPGKSEPAAAVKVEKVAQRGKSFGAGVKLAQATSIDTILANPKEWDGKTVRVEGMITDVCPKRGCWMELAGSEPGHKLKFKVTDGEMVFPMDAKGQRASAEGVIAVKELSLEESKQYAEYQAKEYGKPYDPASITGPTLVARLDGTGAVIHDAK